MGLNDGLVSGSFPTAGQTRSGVDPELAEVVVHEPAQSAPTCERQDDARRDAKIGKDPVRDKAHRARGIALAPPVRFEAISHFGETERVDESEEHPDDTDALAVTDRVDGEERVRALVPPFAIPRKERRRIRRALRLCAKQLRDDERIRKSRDCGQIAALIGDTKADDSIAKLRTGRCETRKHAAIILRTASRCGSSFEDYSSRSRRRATPARPAGE
jgi:hypothetical protein